MDTSPTVCTCVVVDDEPGVRLFVRRVLTQERFQVFTASDGREAVSLLAALACDLLVTDLTMPGGEGIETIRAVRKQYPAMKILAISRAFGAKMLRTAELLGADASLAKPFTAPSLAQAARRLLAPHR
jgi:CheY-like chemotaxis protein